MSVIQCAGCGQELEQGNARCPECSVNAPQAVEPARSEPVQLPPAPRRLDASVGLTEPFIVPESPHAREANAPQRATDAMDDETPAIGVYCETGVPAARANVPTHVDEAPTPVQGTPIPLPAPSTMARAAPAPAAPTPAAPTPAASARAAAATTDVQPAPNPPRRILLPAIVAILALAGLVLLATRWLR